MKRIGLLTKEIARAFENEWRMALLCWQKGLLICARLSKARKRNLENEEGVGR